MVDKRQQATDDRQRDRPRSGEMYIYMRNRLRCKKRFRLTITYGIAIWHIL